MNPAEKHIRTPDDLINILGKDIQNGVTKGNRYVLEASLDCCEIKNFVPLGNGTKYALDGELDGCGHTIQNLTIKVSQAYNLALLTKISQEGKVTNLRIENISIVQDSNALKTASTTTIAGVVAAICQGEISNCAVRGAISLQNKTENCQAGGLCGSLPFETAKVTNSWSDVSIFFQDDTKSASDDAYSIGGIAGYSNGQIANCHSRSELSPPTMKTAGCKLGGICGTADSCCAVSSCYNIGRLHGRASASDLLGGIVADVNSGATFSNCYYLNKCLPFENPAPVGTAKSWPDLVKAGFASELGPAYTDTPEGKDRYTYTPFLQGFAAPALTANTCNEFYLEALCTPVALSFSQSAFPGTDHPVKVDCGLFNCGLQAVSLEACKTDHTKDVFVPEISGTSFCYDLGNNVYSEYHFVLTLIDKYGRTAVATDADMDNI
jgi:hypothetical protein